MSAIETNRAWWRGARRRWRGWLRRNGWYTALLIVLGVAMLEPLSCILHCQLWLHTSGSDGALHAHHHTALTSTALFEQSADAPSSQPHASLATTDPCLDHAAQRGPSPAPGQTGSARAHEHQGTIGVLTLLTIVLVIRRIAASRSPWPVPWAIAPPFRPPIAINPSY